MRSTIFIAAFVLVCIVAPAFLQGQATYEAPAGSYYGLNSGASTYSGSAPSGSAPTYSGAVVPYAGYPSGGAAREELPLATGDGRASTYPPASYSSASYSPASYPPGSYPPASYSSGSSPSGANSPEPYAPARYNDYAPPRYGDAPVYRTSAEFPADLPPPGEVPLFPAEPPLPAAKPAATKQPAASPAPAADPAPAPPGVLPEPGAPPLTTPFPSWFSFKDFTASKLWTGTIQLGLNGAAGNSETFNIASGYDLKRETKSLILTTDLKYNKATNRQTETQHNAIFNGKSEFLFPESAWTAFARTYLEYDEFKAFDLRVVSNLGAGYRIINRDEAKLTSRFGSGFSHEIGGPDDSYVPEAVFGMDYTRQFTKRQKLNVKGDYFPEWGDFTNYRVVSTADWELLVDELANLSLKVGVTDRYDSTPNGLKPNDFTYSILVLWKL